MARVRLDFPAEVFTYATTLDVRFDDVNIGGHLGNDRLVSLLGEARSRFFEAIGVPETGSPGVIVTDLVVAYRAEARLRDALRFDVGMAEINRYGGDVAYRVSRPSDDTVIATAKTGIVFFDYEAGRVTGAPERFAQKFPAEVGAGPLTA